MGRPKKLEPGLHWESLSIFSAPTQATTTFFRGTPGASKVAGQLRRGPLAEVSMDLVAEKRAHITPEPPARKRKRKTPPTVTPPEPLVPATSTSPAPPPPFQPTQSAQPFRSAAPPPPQPEPIQPEPTPTAESPPTVPPPADLPRTSPAEPLPQQHQHDDGIHEWILLALAEAGLDVGKAGDSMPLPERLKPLAGRKFVGRAKVAPVSTLPPDKVVDARKSLTTDEWRRCIAFAEEFGLTQRSGGRLFASATRQPMLGVLGVLASNAGRMQGVASCGIYLPHAALVMCACRNPTDADSVSIRYVICMSMHSS